MQITRLDISNKPDLLRIAEAVRNSNNIRILKRENEPLAAVVPMEVYEQWEKDAEELLAIMDKAAKTAHLSSQEADRIADDVIHAIRTT